jgi:hypothetical protein
MWSSWHHLVDLQSDRIVDWGPLSNIAADQRATTGGE